MAKKIKHQVNLNLRDNAMTKEDTEDKIFTVHFQGTADRDRIIAEMMKVNPGLEEETVQMVYDLQQRVVLDLLFSGYRVNTGLYHAELTAKGVTYDGVWDPNVNSLSVNFTQGKDAREALEDTIINVEGEKGATMRVTSGASAIGKGYVVKAGRSFTLRGKNIKVAGDDPSVGITLTDSEKAVTRIEGDLIVQNDPTTLVFIIPGELANGEYELKVTTQFTSGGNLLKTPRSVMKTLYVGEAPDPVLPGGGDDSDDGESPDPIV